MTILIIDDSNEDCFLLKKMLKNLYKIVNITTCHNLEEARKLIHLSNIDVVLLDYYLPDGYGIKFLSEISSFTYSIPVIMLTGSQDNGLGNKTIEAGAQDYLIKGEYDALQLKKSIEYSIERIKNRKEIEKEKNQKIEALKTQEKFMSIMTHELITPLIGIINGVQLLREDLKEGDIEECEDMCTIIENSGQSLYETIKNILEYTAIHSKGLLVSKEQVSINSIVLFINSNFSMAAKEKGLNFLVKKGEQLPDNFISDQRRVEQILYNLISNALKFTEEGSISISLFRESDKIVFSIKDTGVGIKKDSLDKIFSSFTQEDFSNSRNFGGSGLGLSIAASLVTLLGGEISVDSTLNVGSKFTFSIAL